ncbi:MULTISPECIES: hypothetical protein [Anaeromyxobacter]|uniref:hypothetical protein n=1 Tax=Anaeromyxobacter TaxID=161492 RepID=UPI001F55DE1B|nr:MULTISPECIES: hypothetical protein [unclassified Anaeromyxobacter]
MHVPPVDPARAHGAPRPRDARSGPRRAERGAVSWVTLVLLAGLGGGAYWLWVWGPVYVVHYEVKQVVHEYINQAVRNPRDAELVRNMVHKLETLAKVDGVDAYGGPARVPAVVVDPADVTWERDANAAPPTLHVAFQYERSVTYPFLDRTGTRVFTVDVDGDLSRPNWGPER